MSAPASKPAASRASSSGDQGLPAAAGRDGFFFSAGVEGAGEEVAAGEDGSRLRHALDRAQGVEQGAHHVGMLVGAVAGEGFAAQRIDAARQGIEDRKSPGNPGVVHGSLREGSGRDCPDAQL